MELHIVDIYILLTRGRQGMVLWIPQGIPDKLKTLDPGAFDSVYEYLRACGVPARCFAGSAPGRKVDNHRRLVAVAATHAAAPDENIC